MLKSIFTICFVGLCVIACKKNEPTPSSELDPYLSFLEKQETSAKAYILKQFEDHDFVVLSERHHMDMTQYDLFLDVIADPAFTKNVQHIFLEIGTHRMQDRINAFLSKEGLSEDEIHEEVKYIQQNVWYFPLWEKHNYTYLMKRLYEINQGLEKDNKLKVYPSGLYMNWNTTRTFEDMKEAHKYRFAKDSIMALNVIHDIDSLEQLQPQKSHKALLIMNYHHAFNDRFTHENACTHFLFKKYGNRITNILVHAKSFLMDQTGNDPANYGADVPIQNGKWDAAFALLDNPTLGFDLENSPFGNDGFDYYPYEEHTYTYKDIFKGYVFYKPIAEFKLLSGYEGLLENGFKEEFRRRRELFAQYRKNDPSFKLNEVSDFLNTVQEHPVEDLDTIQYIINQRISEHNKVKGIE